MIYGGREMPEDAIWIDPIPAEWLLHLLRGFPDRQITYLRPTGDLFLQAGLIVNERTKRKHRIGFRVAAATPDERQPTYRYYCGFHTALKYAEAVASEGGAAIVAGRYQDLHGNARWIDMSDQAPRR